MTNKADNQVDGNNSNWWGRNWQWLVPVGCLSVLLLFVASIFVLVTFVFGMIRSTDVYQEALARAKASPAVVEALGRPIKDGYFASGSINETGPSGYAELAIPISGPRGDATIYLEAHESADQWTFSKLLLEIKSSGERIDLLDEPKRLPQSEPEPGAVIGPGG